MSLAELAGRSFPRTEPLTVTTERLAEFARAIGAPYDSGSAPVTFPILISLAAIKGLVEDPASGMSLAGLVHGEQRFTYERPVRPGDELTADLTVESVRSMGEAAWLRTRSEIHDQDGEHVLTAWATLIHRQVTPSADQPSSSGPLPAPRTGG